MCPPADDREGQSLESEPGDHLGLVGTRLLGSPRNLTWEGFRQCHQKEQTVIILPNFFYRDKVLEQSVLVL